MNLPSRPALPSKVRPPDLMRIPRGFVAAPGEMVRTAGEATAAHMHLLMRTPARRIVLEAIFWAMPRYLDRKQSADVEASIRWTITGPREGKAAVYDLEVAHGRARVRRGGAETPPRLTITVDGDEFLRLVSGQADPMRAYFAGKLSVHGDIMFAARLIPMFRADKRR